MSDRFLFIYNPTQPLCLNLSIPFSTTLPNKKNPWTIQIYLHPKILYYFNLRRDYILPNGYDSEPFELIQWMVTKKVRSD